MRETAAEPPTGSAAACFYAERDDGALVPTELTRGPWDDASQHGGPPSGLLARAIERCEPRAGARVGRITVELLGPVPIAPLRAQARVVRPGRSVELLEASLSGEDGRTLLRATAWRLATAEVPLPAGAQDGREPALAPPSDGGPMTFPGSDRQVGYHTATDYVSVHGDFMDPGPAAAWLRMHVALVAGEQPSPLQRTMVAADIGNGISAVLPWDRYVFINTDLTVHLHRLPAGEWIGVDAVTHPEADGIGIADARLHDERGPIGRAVQTLFIRQR